MKIDVYEDGHGIKVIRTLEPLSYTVAGHIVTVPPGFTSDGFSCPRLLQILLSPQCDPRTLHAGLAHDHLYETHLSTRREADAFLRDDLVRHKFPLVLSYISWLAVRLFGWMYW